MDLDGDGFITEAEFVEQIEMLDVLSPGGNDTAFPCASTACAWLRPWVPLGKA